MPNLAKPNWKTGDVIGSIKLEPDAKTPAKRDNWRITGVSNGILTIESDSGNMVTKSDEWFCPALKWNDEGSKGTSVVDFQVGSLWPLANGNKAYFHRVVTREDQSKFEENWRCTVEGPINVRLNAASNEAAAYKITCDTGVTKRVWYWGAQEGMGPLEFVRTSSADAPGGAETEKFTRA